MKEEEILTQEELSVKLHSRLHREMCRLGVRSLLLMTLK